MDREEMLKAREKVVAQMQEIASAPGSKTSFEVMARLVGEPFDPENPVAPVIAATARQTTVGIGEDYDYFVPNEDTKEVHTITNGGVTQQSVTPLTENTLTFNDRSSKEYLVYIPELLKGKEDTLARKRAALTESLDRIEEYEYLQTVDSAVKAANKFTLDSGKENLDFPKIIEMVRKIARYARVNHTDTNQNDTNLVLITGANVTQDVVLMDYRADGNREVSLAKAGISRWITVDGQAVDLDGSTKNVIDPDAAYLMAPDKGEGRETAHFVRRLVDDIQGGSGPKNRITINRGPIMPEGSNRRWAMSTAAMEEYGLVVVNDNPLVKFTRS